MATAVEKVAEEVLDVADAVLDDASEAVDTARGFDFRAFGAGISFGAVVGAGICYLVVNKRLRTKYDAIADEEIAGMKRHYDKKLRSLEIQSEKKTIDEVAQDLGYATEGDGKVAYHRVGSEPDKASDTITPEPELKNVFENDDDPEVEMTESWNMEKEIASRSAAEPYVIHRDEYNEGVTGDVPFDQYTLTYFEGDDVLCREDDQIIADQDEVVGLGNLAKFGHGSGDPNVVYIRNEKLKVDIEVTHSDGKYAQEVAGFTEDELQHSSMRRRLPRRSEYDAND